MQLSALGWLDVRGNKLTEKTSLEQKLLTGLYGTPELKREERRHLLGQFRERVIKALTFKQIAEPGTYSEITEAITHPKARRLIISRKANLASAAEYIRLARDYSLSFATVDLPDFKGPVGLVVAADEAVDEEEIFVPSREERMLALGVPQALIDARGQSVCPDCLNLLKQVAPEELSNYRKLSLLDRLLGNKCPCSNRS